MQPVLKQRKTKIVSGWLTRDGGDGRVILFLEDVERDELFYDYGGWWYHISSHDAVEHYWGENEFKALYTGIPRKGRAIYVQIEIVVD